MDSSFAFSCKRLKSHGMEHDTPLAVLADIHGNALALEAVLAHARGLGISRFVNLGDTFYGPLSPAATWAILRGMAMPTVLGNQDRILFEDGPQWTENPAHQAALAALGESGLAWLRSLPPYLIVDKDILLTHGTPGNDMKYLLEDVSTGHPVLRDCSAIEADILPEARNCTLVLAGHSHYPGQTECNGRTLVNPGSVGLPAYDDDTPPHAMAAGSPHARYAVVKRRDTGWQVDYMAVEYDWNAAAAMAKANGRNDWAVWLETGKAL